MKPKFHSFWYILWSLGKRTTHDRLWIDTSAIGLLEWLDLCKWTETGTELSLICIDDSTICQFSLIYSDLIQVTLASSRVRTFSVLSSVSLIINILCSIIAELGNVETGPSSRLFHLSVCPCTFLHDGWMDLLHIERIRNSVLAARVMWVSIVLLNKTGRVLCSCAKYCAIIRHLYSANLYSLGFQNGTQK